MINPPRTIARKCLLGGGLYVCAGRLDIENLLKSPLIYSISYFNLGALSVRATPTKATSVLRGGGLGGPWPSQIFD